MIQNWLEKLVMMKMHYITSRLKTVNWYDKNYLYLIEGFQNERDVH